MGNRQSGGSIKFEYELRPDGGKIILGRGSFGTVYCGVEKFTHVRCAIKESDVEDPKTIPSLENESRKLRNMDHRNIVQFLGADLSEDGSTLRLFLERVPGQNLSMMVRDRGEWGPLKYDERMFATVAVQVMQGLSYLHENDILHRDIKGKNIMVDTEATPHRCKLCDFGMAKHTNTVTIVNSESSIVNLGTIAFTAPEVIEGSKHSKSLSISAQLIYRITTDRTPPEVPSEVSDACKDYVSQFLQSDPRDRPSAQELIKHPHGFVVFHTSTREADYAREKIRVCRTSNGNAFLDRIVLSDCCVFDSTYIVKSGKKIRILC